MKIGLTLLGGFELSIGNDKPQSTQNENINKEISIQQTSKLIEYDKHGESMYNRLQRICHPKNFVDNYDKDKVDAANVIYSQLLSTDRDDINAVAGLVVMAEKQLNTNLLDEYQFEKLKNILNPKNYMEPYDASSIALSNELYSQLMQPDLNFTTYVQIISKSEPLLKIIEERDKKQKEQEEQKKKIEKQKQKEQEEQNEKNEKTVVIISVILMLIVIILGIIGKIYD
ncbi:MAG: hypothetical protein PUC50_00880 [Bacteroidales bacterium]|nr:hypothetical protein [Bacteroidales bacterium]